MLIEMSERIMKKIKAVFYARVSTDHSDQLHSLKAQQDYFYQYLDNHQSLNYVIHMLMKVLQEQALKKGNIPKMVNDALHHLLILFLQKK